MKEQPKKTHTIHFTSPRKDTTIIDGETLLAAAQQAEVPLLATCGGRGKCGQCRVHIDKGAVPELTESEKTLLSPGAIEDGERLACLIPVISDMEISIAKDTTSATTRLQTTGIEQDITLEPFIISQAITVDPPTRQDTRSDFKRVADAVMANNAGNYTASVEVVRQISHIIRKEGAELTAFLRNSEIVGLAPKDSRLLGVAIDLGTTKIAASLLDLQTGEELGTQGHLNPQISYGGDLISRLTYANSSAKNADTLAHKVHHILNTMLGQLVEDAGVSRQQITEICIVGNTAMTHLLLKLPVAQLAGAPYVAATHKALDVKAADLGLFAAPGATVHIPGTIGGFTGADHVSMILASRLYEAKHVTLGIDIGTNSEIALYSPLKGTLTSCSCASGPAFEGGHVSCGMRAATGAIETARFNGNKVDLGVIGDAPPKGICGSGIIDILAELCRNSIISSGGLLDKTHPLVRQSGNMSELVLSQAADSADNKDIVVTQKDISEIQLAKGAIRAGMESLLSVTETDPADVEEVIVAGAFGSYLDLKSVSDIGMFPHFENARLVQIGNAALEGAKMMLLSKTERKNGEFIVDNGVHFETSIYKNFNSIFARGIQFPHPVN